MKIPIIGCGGIMKVEDVVEYMLAGASAVEVRLFHLPQSVRHDRDHRRAGEVVRASKGFARVADLTGAMIHGKPQETYAAAAAPIG